MKFLLIIILATALWPAVGHSTICDTVKYLMEKSALLRQPPNTKVCASVCAMNATIIINKQLGNKDLDVNNEATLWSAIKAFDIKMKADLAAGAFAYGQHEFITFLFKNLGLPANISTHLTDQYAEQTNYQSNIDGVTKEKDLLPHHIIPNANSMSVLGVEVRGGRHAILVVSGKKIRSEVNEFGKKKNIFEIEFIDPHFPELLVKGELTQQMIRDFNDFDGDSSHMDFLFSLPMTSELRRYAPYYEAIAKPLGAATMIKTTEQSSD